MPHFSPNQIRKATATHVNRVGGEAAAQQVLGHSTPDTTRENYIDPSIEKASDYAREHG